MGDRMKGQEPGTLLHIDPDNPVECREPGYWRVEANEPADENGWDRFVTLRLHGTHTMWRGKLNAALGVCVVEDESAMAMAGKLSGWRGDDGKGEAG